MLAGLDPTSLEHLADALTTGRLRPPFADAALRRLLAAEQVPVVHRELTELAAKGFQPQQVAILLHEIAAERQDHQRQDDRLELVWSGPPAPGPDLRDTAAVVRGLCRAATRNVLVANFAFDKPHNEEQATRPRALWQPLADLMAADPAMHVRMIVNIGADDNNKTDRSGRPLDLVAEFIKTFRKFLWPGPRLPELYYDPRALHMDRRQRAIMHAKCIVVDETTLFLSSANFTHAAQERNIEAGLVIERPVLARQITAQFGALISVGALLPLKTD